MTEDLYRQAEADFLRAKARKGQTSAAVLRAQADDAEAEAELARMQHVLDWWEPYRPQEHGAPQERAATPAPAQPRRSARKPTRARKAKKENLSDLVEGAVRQIGGLVRNGAILEHLQRAGYHYDALQVRGSAKHLAQKGRLVSGGYGIWTLPGNAPQPEDAPQLDFTPAAPAAEVDRPSENGHVPVGMH